MHEYSGAERKKDAVELVRKVVTQVYGQSASRTTILATAARVAAAVPRDDADHSTPRAPSAPEAR
jgi:hypothetical protein